MSRGPIRDVPVSRFRASSRFAEVIDHLLGMTVQTLQSEVWVPCPRERVFEFFSRAENLEAVTPGWLHFSILSPSPVKMKTGTRIRYRLRLHGIPLRWESEITAWEPPHRFVDEQKTGPYRLWIHEHQFLEHDGGTTVRDTVQYAVAGGELLHRLFVAPDLKEIFEFRRQKVTEIFRPKLCPRD